MARKCEVRNVSKLFGTTPVVNDVSFDVEEGEFVVLLGPSGCGKTTTLRMIAGLERSNAGTIAVNGRVLSDPQSGLFVRPEHRDIGMVFQSYAIWPHMTVFENVAYPLKARRAPRAEIPARVRRVLEVVGLDALADRSAVSLSGGQMQRVALARALVYDPSLVLFDEPLSNLDLKLRERLRVELKDLQRRTGLTGIYVTHDQSEAMELGDKVIVMDGGKIVQIGPPSELYRAPTQRFVAEFISSANIFVAATAKRQDFNRILVTTPGGRELSVDEPRLVEGVDVDVVIHPEDCQLSLDAASGIEVSVRGRQLQGTATRYTVDWGGEPFDVMSLGTRAAFENGARVRLVIPPDAIRLLPREGRRS